MEEKHFGPVWVIPGEKGGRYPYCHSLYIEGAGILIDPASDRKRLSEIRDNPGVKEVWLSHWHEDHIMHLDLFDDLPFCVSEQDASPLSDLELFMDAYGMNGKDYRDYWKDILTKSFHFKSREPEKFLRGGENIDLGSVSVEILSTPGHTPGNLSFFFNGPELLFIGDYDLSDFGPWYGDIDSSIEETIASVEKLRKIPAKIWVTGHETGLFEKNPGELWDKYLSVIDNRDAKLLKLLETPQSIEDIAEAWIVYGKPREPKAFFYFGEKALMTKHLERMIRKGIVAREKERYFKL